MIVPDPTAHDLYRFSFHDHRKEEFYVNEVVGSANYHCGDDLADCMSLWLNYLIEHHLIPDLPMRQYRLIQPRVKALCEKHGIPYRQESVFRRFGRMLDVAVGRTSMRELEAFPRGLATGRRSLSAAAHAAVAPASDDAEAVLST